MWLVDGELVKVPPISRHPIVTLNPDKKTEEQRKLTVLIVPGVEVVKSGYIPPPKTKLLDEERRAYQNPPDVMPTLKGPVNTWWRKCPACQLRWDARPACNTPEHTKRYECHLAKKRAKYVRVDKGSTRTGG